MATTVSNFSAIDDTEVDAESPITETLVTRLRDNSYWIDPATTRTTATSNTLVLTPNATAGTTQWQEVSTIAGLDGTKGVAPSLTASYQVLVSKTSDKLLKVEYDVDTCVSFIIDTSDDTYVGNDGNSGTITTGQTVHTGGGVSVRLNGGNYEIAETGAYTWNAGMYFYL